MAALNGNDVYISVDGKTISCSLSDTLTVTQATKDTTTKCTGSGSWTSATPGKKSWEISVEGVYDSSQTYDFDEFFTEIISGTTCAVRFGWKGGYTSGGTYWSGTAIVTSLTQTSPLDDRVTWSATLVGTGALAQHAYT